MVLQFVKNLLKVAAVQAALKAVAKSLVGLFTRKATPAARTYAANVTEETVDHLPEIIDRFGEIRSAYQKNQFGLNAQTAEQLGYLSQFPRQAYQHYKNYQFLNCTASAPAMVDMDDFVLVDSAKSKIPAVSLAN